MCIWLLQDSCGSRIESLNALRVGSCGQWGASRTAHSLCVSDRFGTGTGPLSLSPPCPCSVAVQRSFFLKEEAIAESDRVV